MVKLSDEQLNSFSKEALVFLVSSLQDQLASVLEQLDTANTRLSENNKKIDFLTEQIRIMNQRRFGRKSEKGLYSPEDGQMTIFDFFNEAEYRVHEDLKEPEISEVVVPGYRRSKKKGKREEDLEGLPVRVIEHKLSDEELADLFPEGYKELPDEIYKRLFIIPETFIVDEHHVHVYASKKNNGRMIKAPRPADLFRNSIATPALLASVMNAKFANALPLDRQSRVFKSNGINLPTNTLAGWVIKGTETYLSLLYDYLHERIYHSRVIHADESPVKVMRIDNQKIKNGKQTYMWVYRSRAVGSPPIILFEWQPSRRADHPREFLKGFSGTVVTDGYQVYHMIDREREDLNVAGCWIHCRRPFAEFIKSLTPEAAKDSIAQEAYLMITELLHLDNEFDDLSSEDRLKQRQLILQDKVDAYFEWVKRKYAQVTHNSVIGRALAYSINQEKYLRMFLTDGDIPMENNAAEQAIRPFTVGRKNFVFIESDNGAKASAMLYSIVETAKANHLNTYKYLEMLLRVIPQHMNDKDRSFLDVLLPWSDLVQKECRIPEKKS